MKQLSVVHKTVVINGITTFYREAGDPSLPTLLLPHGYPSSSFQYRNLMPALADKWHVISPDFPGFGYSDTPEGFEYTFDGYAAFLDQLVRQFGFEKFAVYLHDYGSQIGLRLAMMDPARIAGLIIQNGDIYEDVLGPGYDGLKEYWQNPTSEKEKELYGAVSEDGFRKEFIEGLDESIASLVPPDVWKLSTALLLTPERRDIMVGLMKGLKQNLAWMSEVQAYLRTHQPPTLILWGPQDGYMPEEAGRAYLRDLPNAEFHLFDDGGHWLLETHFERALPLIRAFLEGLAVGSQKTLN